MNMSLNIHPELRSIKSRPMRQWMLNRWVLAAMQNAVSVINALHRRKFKSVATRTTIASSDGYSIPVVLIRPENLSASAPAFVYFHGGAFLMKPVPQHFENALRYAREAVCLVVFVEYRLAPQHPFPAGFNDCYAALRWTLSNAQKLGIDKERVAVGGDSAGGGLAAGVAQRARQDDRVSLSGQLLMYPAVDLFCTRPSIVAYRNVPPFMEHSTPPIARAYLGREGSQDVPRYACPINGDVTGVAPAYVETAQFDVLHDQGDAYAQMLLEKGVELDRNEIEGGIHGFDMLAADSTVAKAAMQRRIQFLRRIFAR